MSKKLKVKGDWKIRKPGVGGGVERRGNRLRKPRRDLVTEVSLSTELFQRAPFSRHYAWGNYAASKQ